MAKLFPYYLPGTSISHIGSDIIIRTRHLHPLAGILILLFNLAWLIVSILLLYRGINAQKIVLLTFGLGTTTLTAWTFILALRLTLNRITITINAHRKLEREEGPVRTKGGNWERAVEQVDQFYLPRQENSKEGRHWYTYSGLFVKMNDGEQLQILPKSTLTTYRRAKALEDLLEQHLKIEDRRLAGEYDPEEKIPIINPPDPMRHGRRPGDQAQKRLTPDLHLMAQRDIIVIEDQNYQVQQAWQYSWENGQTDQWVSILDTDNRFTGIFFEQDLGEYKPYRSKVIQLESALNFKEETPPVTLHYEGDQYEVYQLKIGERHLRWQPEEAQQAVRQYIYLAIASEHRIRVEYLHTAAAIIVHQDIGLNQSTIEDFLSWT